MELVSAARDYEARAGTEASLGGFVDRLSLVSDTDKEAGARDARIFLMTLHSAKGLEFPAVFVAGLEEGLLPHSRSSAEPAELEEERRLCYVGMTRARAHLYLSNAAKRRVFGEYRPAQPSRFLTEIPDHLFEHIGSPRPTLFADMAPGGRGGSGRSPGHATARMERSEPSYDYASEDQSSSGISLGARVRHPHFGVGTVVGVNDEGDDLKVAVRFVNVGVKQLIARYARLERI